MSDPIIEELKIEEIEINSMEAEAKSRLTLLADFATYRVVAVGEAVLQLATLRICNTIWTRFKRKYQLSIPKFLSNFSYMISRHFKTVAWDYIKLILLI